MSSELILPTAPDNLERLAGEEQRIRTEALLHINQKPDLRDHLAMLEEARSVIHAFTRDFPHRTENEKDL